MKTKMKIMMRAIAIALCLAAACFANNQRAGNLVFVHATDPHLFMPAAQASDKDKKAAGERQESLNQKALADMLQRIQGFSGDQVPAFLVLTGDLGVDPCDIPMSQPTSPPPSKQCIVGVDAAKRNDEIERVSKDLGASPLKEIYLVAGNNDVANEDPGDVSLDYFNRFIDDVQKKLNDAKTGVQVHNLTACYIGTGGSSSCYADVSNGYRLIGFPSYSFKNQRGNSSNNDEQVKQFETFRSLVDQARQAGKQVIVLSHIPEIDDPYVLAQDRYDAKAPESSSDKDAKNPRSLWSTWNVSAKILDGWRDVLQSDTVIAVLAGHLHDSHKEIYRRTYTWSASDDHRLGF
ncbi:MAG: metallophosphoesterase, partial [Bryobacterales bacterium]|nr:metallophosphoesterase [Bryobacterales bacterium]